MRPIRCPEALVTNYRSTLRNMPEELRSHSYSGGNSEPLLRVFWRCQKKVKVKWSRYRPGVAQTVGRGLALLFHDRGTRKWWVVSSTPRPHFTPGKDPVPILQGAGWAPGPFWTGGKSHPHRDSISDRPACSQSLYWLSYRAHDGAKYGTCIKQYNLTWSSANKLRS